MMFEPQVSIVIPCYNDGRFLPEALASWAGCAIPIEVIIVDDGSTDPETISYLAALEEKGNAVVIRQENSGQNASRNRGISQARAVFVVPFDCDNKLSVSALELALARIQKDDRIAVVYGDAEIFGLKQEMWINRPLDVREMILANQIDTCALIRKAAWSDVGGYPGDPSIRSHEEWLFWLRLLQHGWKFEYLGATFFQYRMRPDSMLRTAGADMRKVTKVFAVAYGLQKELIPKLVAENTLSGPESKRLLAQVEAKLAYNQMVYGDFFAGLRIWMLALVHGPQMLGVHGRIAMLGPVKRIALDLFGIDLRAPKRSG